jgi:hypothetical protein
MSILIIYNPLTSTSESYDFILTRNQIIEQAFRKVGVLSDDNVLTAAQYNVGSLYLNAMVKLWAADDIYIWKEKRAVHALTASSVVLGTDGNDYECIRKHTSSSITKPITGANYKGFWKQLTTSAGAAWANDTNYESIQAIELNSNVIDLSDLRIIEGNEFEMLTQLTRNEFFNLENTDNSGKPNSYYFEKSNDANLLYLYPYPDSATDYVIDMTEYIYAEDMDDSDNNPDYLQEWIKPLIDGLAIELAPTRGMFGDQLRTLKSEARESKNIARGANGEKGDTQISPRLK